MNNVIKTILDSEDLPTPPGVALRLLELFPNPEVEVSEMADVIGADPALSARLIAYCNSPLLARTQPTTSIQQAIVVIGMRAVKTLALSFSLVRAVPSAEHGFDYDAFWARSLATAVVSKTFGSLDGTSGEEEFLLGLMLGIGQVGLAQTFPARYSELAAQSVETGVPLIELEREEWSVNRHEISAELMRHWNFPQKLVTQVQAFGETRENEDSRQVRILTMSWQVVAMLFEPDLSAEEVEKTKGMANRWFGLNPEQFGEAFDWATELWTDFAKLLEYNATQAQTFEQLERRALKGIAQNSMGLHAENAAIKQQNVQLKVNANVDSLTGLKNRRAFDESAIVEWERSQRLPRPFALMMVDIDHFKKVNDTHGHLIGDQTLVAVANALTENVRRYDLVYRFGGEEFVIIIPECEPAAAIDAANRFREAISKLEIPIHEGVLKITASFGVAVNRPPQSRPLKELMEEADELMYQAKNEGRNRVCSNNTPAIPPVSIHNSQVNNSMNLET